MNRVFLIGTLAVITLYFFVGAASALPLSVRTIDTRMKNFTYSGLETLLVWNNLSENRDTGNIFWQDPGHVAIDRAKYWYADHERDLGFLDKQKFVPLNWRGQWLDASADGVFDISNQNIFPFEQKVHSTGITWFANSLANPANLGVMVATFAMDSDGFGNTSIVAWEDLAITVDWSYSDQILGLSGESLDKLMPEAAIMFLFGISLLGLVAIGRKKLLKE